MQNQYFVYKPEFFNRDNIAGQVTVLNPQVPSEDSKKSIRNIHRYSVTLIICAIAGLFGLFSIFTASGAGVFLVMLAIIVSAILLSIWSLDKNAAVTITLNESKLSRRIAQAAALAKVGALDENESRLIAKLIWDTHGLRKRLEGNQALENAVSSIVEKVEMRLEDRENDVIQKSLREGTVPVPAPVNDPGELPNTWYEHDVKQPPRPNHASDTTNQTKTDDEWDPREDPSRPHQW